MRKWEKQWHKTLKLWRKNFCIFSIIVFFFFFHFMWKNNINCRKYSVYEAKGELFVMLKVVLFLFFLRSFNIFITWNLNKEIVSLHILKHHWQPSTSNKITGLDWRSAFKSVNFGLYSCQGVFSYSIFRCKKKETRRSLINKTVGSQYSLWCVPPGISIPLLWALIKCLNSDGCFFFFSFGSR